jgi:hypothetical protein
MLINYLREKINYKFFTLMYFIIKGVGYTEVSESIICSDCTSEGGCENLSRLYKREYSSGFCVWRNGECEYDEDNEEAEDASSSPEDPCNKYWD